MQQTSVHCISYMHIVHTTDKKKNFCHTIYIMHDLICIFMMIMWCVIILYYLSSYCYIE